MKTTITSLWQDNLLNTSDWFFIKDYLDKDGWCTNFNRKYTDMPNFEYRTVEEKIHFRPTTEKVIEDKPTKEYSMHPFWNRIAHKIFDSIELKKIEALRLEGLFAWNDENDAERDKYSGLDYTQYWELEGFTILKQRNTRRNKKDDEHEFHYATFMDGRLQNQISYDFDTQLLVSLSLRHEGYNGRFAEYGSKMLGL